ncbi:diguanylate cyclase [Hyphomicrobium sp.]|uniref:sensor domain-containing diguanylate cyclase n=1 Tax=Hyphomicrobium sp. TaxID=82 RepID=UPI003F7252C0
MRNVQESSGVKLARWIGLAMGLPALVAVVLLGKDAILVVNEINENALKREQAAVERGIKLLGELHASEMVSQTNWDAAFHNVVLNKRTEWIRKNFGSEALSPSGPQQIVIVDPSGRATFSSEFNAAPPPDKVAGLLAAAAVPMDRARKLYKDARVSGDFDKRQDGAMTDGLYVNDFVKLDGQAALITVSPFTPDDEAIETPSEPTLLIGVQVMTPAVLDKLESLSHIDELNVVSPKHLDEAGENTHPVLDARGNVIAHLSWDFASPGHAILLAALPAIAVSLGLIVAMTLFAALTVRRLTRRLAESEQTALYASRHDAATGLANRGWFMSVFSNLLTSREQKQDTYAVLLIDCDHFKAINDTLGHAAGDAVLRAIADRLRALDGRLTIFSRLGGDEFAAVTRPLACTEDAAAVVHLVERTLMMPVLYGSKVLDVSVSIGAAVFEAPSPLSVDVWLAKADIALYRAKRDGRGCSRLFDPAQDGDAPETLSPFLRASEAAAATAVAITHERAA